MHPLAGLFASDLHATTQRPLFETSRRPMGVKPPVLPDARPAAPQVAAVPDTSGLRLVGVITSEESRTALLTPGGGGKTFRVETGDTVEGWTVETIKLDTVTLRRQGKRDQLRMQRQALE